jgi:hypothetical protein
VVRCPQADSGGVKRVTEDRPAGRASWRQPVVPETGNREEATMHPAIHYDVMQAQQHDLMRSVVSSIAGAMARYAGCEVPFSMAMTRRVTAASPGS